MIKYVLLFLSIVSCANLNNSQPVLQNSVRTYSYNDQSGKYNLLKEVKLSKNKLILRQRLYAEKNLSSPLEKTIIVSKLGRVQNRISLLPVTSQYTVWLNKARYFTQIKLNRKEKQLEIRMQSPNDKWNGLQKVKLPKEKYFCFFSQLSDCIKAHNLFPLAQEKKISIIIVWDNYPYHEEIFEGMKSTPYSLTKFYMVEKNKEEAKFALDIGGQLIFYHFDNKLNLDKIFWISQGLSINYLKE